MRACTGERVAPAPGVVGPEELLYDDRLAVEAQLSELAPTKQTASVTLNAKHNCYCNKCIQASVNFVLLRRLRNY